MIKDILRLKYQGGLSHDRIARSLSISKGAVAKYLSLVGAAGLDWASTAELDEASLERRLMGGGAALSHVVEPDYARVHIELRRRGVTLILLWAGSTWDGGAIDFPLRAKQGTAPRAQRFLGRAIHLHGGA